MPKRTCCRSRSITRAKSRTWSLRSGLNVCQRIPRRTRSDCPVGARSILGVNNYMNAPELRTAQRQPSFRLILVAGLGQPAGNALSRGSGRLRHRLSRPTCLRRMRCVAWRFAQVIFDGCVARCHHPKCRCAATFRGNPCLLQAPSCRAATPHRRKSTFWSRAS